MNQFKKKIGSRAEVFHGLAESTTGGLTKDDLIKNPKGVIVSKKMRERALEQNHLGNFLQPKSNKKRRAREDLTFGDKVEKN